ncbi:MAG: hypothetical protein H6717_04845 [Polyangiaceae bacterium]|nr:hypothetical protein [Polyangiaceae bacterium]
MPRDRFEPRTLDITRASPDGRVLVVLEWLDEIHFGPPYYSLWMRPAGSTDLLGPGRGRYHGGFARFSPDSRYLVIERWKSLRTPDNEVVLCDLELARETVLLASGPRFLREATRVGNDWRLSLEGFDGSAWSRSLESVGTEDAWKPLGWWEPVDER